jgi:hypothetical protein
MSALAIIALAATALCMFLAGHMAERRARSPKPWVWLAALLGPLPLAVLACLTPGGAAQASRSSPRSR